MKKQQHNKGIPKLRFPEFRKDGEWRIKVLSELGDLINGLTYSPDDVREEGLLVLRSSNIQNGLIDLNDCVYVRKDIRGVNLIKSNDILVCVRNGSKALIGKNAIIPQGMPLTTHGAFMTVFRANNPEFVFQLFQTYFYDDQVKADLGATINSINGKNFLRYEFPVPPKLKEQQKIASCLSSLDEVIELESEKLTALQTHKRGLLQKLFPAEGKKAPELRFREFRKEGEWEEKKLGEVADYSSKRIPLSELELDSYISTENILPDYRGITKSSKLPNNGSFTKYEIGDILVSNIRPYLKKIWMANKEGGASNDILVFKGKLGINKIFLSFILKNDRFIKAMMQGARGVKMPRGDKFLIITYPIFLPTLKEQEKIASCLSSIDELIESQSKKIEQLKNHKKGLMQQLFPNEETIS